MDRREFFGAVAAVAMAPAALPDPGQAVGMIPVLFDKFCPPGRVFILNGHAFAHPSDRDGPLLQGRDWVYGNLEKAKPFELELTLVPPS